MNTLYTTQTCPKCRVAKIKLDQSNIPYEVYDLDLNENPGISQVPTLKLEDGRLLEFGDIIEYT